MKTYFNLITFMLLLLLTSEIVEAQRGRGRGRGRGRTPAPTAKPLTNTSNSQESRRLSDLMNRSFDSPEFGNVETRGFLVKEIGGETIAEMNANTRFQPLSTLKLLPYFHAMIEIDQGRESMDTRVSWTESTVDNPDTEKIDERLYQNCFPPNAPNTRINSATLTDALPTMMWESHNRTLDIFLDKYQPKNITARIQRLGLTDTEMHYGCSGDWTKNRSTLYDLEKLFAGIHFLKFIKNEFTRDLFYDNMINITYTGASYNSPITGKKIGPLYNNNYRSIVQREAANHKLPSNVTDEFLKHVKLVGKGGGGGHTDNTGYSDFLFVTLPIKKGGLIKYKKFVAGWYINGLNLPNGCITDKEKKTKECKAIWQPEWNDLSHFKKEMLTIPIRQALKTWLEEDVFKPQPPSTPPPTSKTDNIRGWENSSKSRSMVVFDGKKTLLHIDNPNKEGFNIHRTLDLSTSDNIRGWNWDGKTASYLIVNNGKTYLYIRSFNGYTFGKHRSIDFSSKDFMVAWAWKFGRAYYFRIREGKLEGFSASFDGNIFGERSPIRTQLTNITNLKLRGFSGYTIGNCRYSYYHYKNGKSHIEYYNCPPR